MYRSAFIGNGKLGMFLRAADANTLTLAVSSSAVWDDREQGSPYAKVGSGAMAQAHMKDNNFVCDRPRLPSGYFTIAYQGTLISAQMRQVLYDGAVVGNITTTEGVRHRPLSYMQEAFSSQPLRMLLMMRYAVC